MGGAGLIQRLSATSDGVQVGLHTMKDHNDMVILGKDCMHLRTQESFHLLFNTWAFGFAACMNHSFKGKPIDRKKNILPLDIIKRKH